MNSNLLQWNEMCCVPDCTAMKGFLLGSVDYLDDGESAPAKRARGRTGTSTTPLICTGPFFFSQFISS